MIQRSHPLGVALRQVIVDSDEVDALAFKRIQVEGKCGDQGLAFAGFHFRDASPMENDAADQLDVEMPHIELAPGHFPAYRKRFRQKVIQGFSGIEPLAEFLGLVDKRMIGEGSQSRPQAH